MDPPAQPPAALEQSQLLHRPETLSSHRWLGVLYLTGGICGAASVIVPPIDAQDLVTLAVTIPAIGVGIGLISRRRPLDERMVSILLLLATVALSAGLLIDGDQVVAAAGGVFYVWIAWTAGTLSTSRQLALQLVACAIGVSCVVIGVGVTTPISVIVIVMGASTTISLAHRRMMQRLRASEATLTHAATHDALTLLPNRELVMRRLSAALMADAEATGLLYVDLDRFKAVNDRFGHREGDAVLKEAARRMNSCIRDSDTLARVGGDEFVILLDGDAEMAADSIATRILEQLRRPFDVGDGTLVQVGASIGIGLAEPGASPADLVRRADLAGLSAKRAGRDRIAAYDRDAERVPPPSPVR
jgi:diguanylate cyclase (GGDEF)-like protein